MNASRVLSVGQCGFDHGRIARFLRDTFGAETIAADTPEKALSMLRTRSFQLILVNRVFDEDGASGIDLIRSIKSEASLASIPTLLVSNYADAQAEAIALGALPGFGKAELASPKAREALDPIFKFAETR